MLRQLEEVKIPIKPLKINPNKTQPIGPALQALLSKSNELKVWPPTDNHAQLTQPFNFTQSVCTYLVTASVTCKRWL